MPSFSVTRVILFLCVLSLVEKAVNKEYNECPEFNRELCIGISSDKYSDIFECQTDKDCDIGRRCCNHCSYTYKICTELISKKASYRIENKKNTHCPEVKPCFRGLLYDTRYRCGSDENCEYQYRCCRSDCYIHKVCVLPVDNLGNQISHILLPPISTVSIPKEADITHNPNINNTAQGVDFTHQPSSNSGFINNDKESRTRQFLTPLTTLQPPGLIKHTATVSLTSTDNESGSGENFRNTDDDEDLHTTHIKTTTFNKQTTKSQGVFPELIDEWDGSGGGITDDDEDLYTNIRTATTQQDGIKSSKSGNDFVENTKSSGTQLYLTTKSASIGDDEDFESGSGSGSGEAPLPHSPNILKTTKSEVSLFTKVSLQPTLSDDEDFDIESASGDSEIMSSTTPSIQATTSKILFFTESAATPRFSDDEDFYHGSGSGDTEILTKASSYLSTSYAKSTSKLPFSDDEDLENGSGSGDREASFSFHSISKTPSLANSTQKPPFSDDEDIDHGSASGDGNIGFQTFAPISTATKLEFGASTKGHQKLPFSDDEDFDNGSGSGEYAIQATPEKLKVSSFIDFHTKQPFSDDEDFDNGSGSGDEAIASPILPTTKKLEFPSFIDFHTKQPFSDDEDFDNGSGSGNEAIATPILPTTKKPEFPSFIDFHTKQPFSDDEDFDNRGGSGDEAKASSIRPTTKKLEFPSFIDFHTKQPFSDSEDFNNGSGSGDEGIASSILPTTKKLEFPPLIDFHTKQPFSDDEDFDNGSGSGDEAIASPILPTTKKLEFPPLIDFHTKQPFSDDEDFDNGSGSGDGKLTIATRVPLIGTIKSNEDEEGGSGDWSSDDEIGKPDENVKSNLTTASSLIKDNNDFITYVTSKIKEWNVDKVNSSLIDKESDSNKEVPIYNVYKENFSKEYSSKGFPLSSFKEAFYLLKEDKDGDNYDDDEDDFA